MPRPLAGAPASAALPALTTLLLAGSVQARDLEITCTRLAEEEQVELRARARLALGALPPETRPQQISLVCDAQRAWLVWQSASPEEIMVDEAPGLLEGALAALDRRISPNAVRAAPTLSETPEPTLDPEEEAVAPSSLAARRRLATGGAGVTLTAEVRPAAVALGPGLDFGIGHRDWSLAVSESVRLEAEESTLLWESRVGVAWGAPYAPERVLGAALLAGVEGLTVIGRDPGPRGADSAQTGLLAAALRLATNWGDVGLWLGVDGAWRFHALEIGAPFGIDLGRWQATATFGALLRPEAEE